MNSGELQRVRKAERKPDKSIIRNPKDHEYIREDLWDTGDQVVSKGTLWAAVFRAPFSSARAQAAGVIFAAGNEMLSVPNISGAGMGYLPEWGRRYSTADVKHYYKEFVFQKTWSWIGLNRQK